MTDCRYVPMRQVLEGTVEVVRLVPRERVQQRTVDVPMSHSGVERDSRGDLIGST